jgi:D-amino-acid dehydrogenase
MSGDSVPEKTWPVVIVGGGIVGICSALVLLRLYPHGVLLVDPLDEFRRASYGNAGVISPASVFPVAAPGLLRRWPSILTGADPGVRIRLGSLPRITPWLHHFAKACTPLHRDAAARALQPLTAAAWQAHVALAAQVGTEHLLAKRGWLRLYLTLAHWQSGQAERDHLRGLGISLTDLNAAQLAEQEPAASRFSFGSLVDDAGSVCRPQDLMRACYDTFVRAGGVVYKNRITRLASAEQPIALHGQDITLRATAVVIAAGASSHQLVKGLGLSVPMAAQRGYHQHYAIKSGHDLKRPCYDVANGYVVAPTRTRQVRVLSGIELGHHAMQPQWGMLELATIAAKTQFELSAEPDDNPWHGDRPSTPDGLPVIGALPNHRNIICAFGHGHIGFSTGPMTAQLVAAQLTGHTPEFNIEHFSPKRFLRR